ncbi:MAG TPA: lipocalin family protein [Candidatus Aquilonibacter sp.]|nr:lipocalin family protein [Candidatus Aquilonibacter sp.]
MNGTTRWITAGTGLSVGVAAGLAIKRARTRSAAPETVPFVDLERYAGRWFEIARYPTRFERRCARNSTAQYTVVDGKLRVVNTCTTQDGDVLVTSGWACVDDPQTNAKLNVRFGPFARGKYWILDLAADYSFAVVGEPHKNFLWILSRTPSLDEAVFARICDSLAGFGYDAGRLQRTLQE